MGLAFVLINTEIGYKERTLERIREVEGVKVVYMFYGIYVILITIQAETTSKLRELVLQIRKIDQVRSTLTMTIVA